MEQQLKQRLVGAVVLVSLAVIFIPIILEGPGDEWSPRNQNIPQPPPMDFRSHAELALPEAEETHADEPVAEAPVPVAVPPAAAVEEPEPPPPAPAVKPAMPEPPAAPPPPAPVVSAPPRESPPAATSLADGWYAQVGSFSQQANADGLRARLAKAGFAAHLQTTSTGKGSSYRVLVGPERTRPDAEKLLQKLVSKAHVRKGIVVEMSASSG